jgi:hypothetical protein
MSPAEIAARLSPAQKKALMWFAEQNHQGSWLPADAAPAFRTHLVVRGYRRTKKITLNDWKAIQELLEPAQREGWLFQLSPLGLAVRAEIERMEKQDGE